MLTKTRFKSLDFNFWQKRIRVRPLLKKNKRTRAKAKGGKNEEGNVAKIEEHRYEEVKVEGWENKGSWAKKHRIQCHSM